MTGKISYEHKKIFLDFIRKNFAVISQREIARRLRIGKTTVNRWSKEIGLKYKKHTVNEHFFDRFNEKSTYMLGYIFADGNVAWNPDKGYYSLTITAAEKDKNHLEKLRRLISSTKPLIYASKTKSFRLIANSKLLCKKLIRLGVIPRKSLVVKFPKYIPKEYLKHFIRGVIDGDGNVRYFKRKRSPYFEISIASGSKIFCNGLISNIKKACCINARLARTNKNVYVARYSCYRGKCLAKFIYSDATIFLRRKYLPYRNHVLKREAGI